MRSLFVRIGIVLWSGILAFLILTVSTAVWGALVASNIKRAPEPWSVLAQAPGVLSGRGSVWCDRPPGQFHSGQHSGSCHWGPDFLHSGMAARRGTAVGVAEWIEYGMVLDARGASGRFHRAGGARLRAPGEDQRKREWLCKARSCLEVSASACPRGMEDGRRHTV